MWAPYIDVVKERFPNALLILDKYHIVHHLMDADLQKTRLSYLEKLNLRINRAYLLKEAFRKF